MTKIFLEVYGYHSETLYPYVVNLAEKDDIILYDPKCLGAESIEKLPQEKFEFSLLRLIKLLRKNNIECLHINSVSVNLHGEFFPICSKTLKIILTPYLCRIFGVIDIQGIVHEADQYFKVDKASNKRHLYFQRFFGKFHIKLFKKVYVLAPEVKKHLKVNSPVVEVLSTRPLTELYVKQKPIDEQANRCVWIGPVSSLRRNWKHLLLLRKEILRDNNIMVDMVCDIRAKEGEELRQKINQLGLGPYFKFREYRPDDSELFSAVQNSTLVLCLYASCSYGTIKTSGARHIALAFDKPVLVSEGGYKIIDHEGLISSASSDINQSILNAMRVS